jgi:flavorubredoxin
LGEFFEQVQSGAARALTRILEEEVAMTHVTEVAPDVFRISTFVPQAGIEFAQFLVRDDEPLLFETGLKGLFPAVREAIAKLIDPAKLRWITFSHFESDECGALNEFLAIAPRAEAACGLVGAATSVSDFASRPPRVLADNEEIATGKRRFRYLLTPHVPHCWDAGLLFETTDRTLFASDLLTQSGEQPPVVETDPLDLVRQQLVAFQKSPFADYMPYTRNTPVVLERLAALAPKTVATMHGSVYRGDGAKVLRGLSQILTEVLGDGRS